MAVSLFPQSFAYARQVLQRDDPGRAAMGISTLRTVFSLAWVAGPPLAAVLLETGGFRLPLRRGRGHVRARRAGRDPLDGRDQGPGRPRPAQDEPLARRPWMAWLAAVAFVLLQTPAGRSPCRPCRCSSAGSWTPAGRGRADPRAVRGAGDPAAARLRLAVHPPVAARPDPRRRRLRGRVLLAGRVGRQRCGSWSPGRSSTPCSSPRCPGLGISYMQDMLPRRAGPGHHAVHQHVPDRRDAGRAAVRGLAAATTSGWRMR